MSSRGRSSIWRRNNASACGRALLYEQFDLAEAEPLDGGLRWLVPALVAAAAASGALLFFLIGQPLYGGLFLAGFVAMLVAAFVIDRRGAKRIEVAPLSCPTWRWSVRRSACRRTRWR